MFRGTHKFADGRFNELIEKNGGISNAGTSLDFTYYHQFLSLDRLELAMYLEADRMTGLKISDKVFEKEKNVVFQERRQRLSADTMRLFWEKYARLFWENSPHGEPISGTDKEIKNISKQDVLDFYNRYYAPNNAVLILSGDIDVETAKELAQKYYGKIKKRPLEKRVNKKKLSFPEISEQGYELRGHRQDVENSRLAGSYHLPPFDRKSPLLYAMIVLDNYLSGSVTSPIYQKMILNKHLAVSAGTSFDFLSRGGNTFLLYAYFQKPAVADKIKRIFLETLNETPKILTSQKLEKVKHRLLAGVVYQNDNPEDAAEIAVRWLGAGYNLSDIRQFEENIKAVRLEDVVKSVEILQKQTPLWGAVIPQTEGKNEL